MLVLTAAVLISPHALPYNLGRVPKVFRWPVPLPPMLYGDGATDRVDLKKFPWWAQLPKEIFHPWGASKQSLTRQVLPCDGYHLRRSEMLCGLDRLRLQSLTFGDQFNQSLDDVTWPAGLQSLTFGWGFDQNLDQVTWPACLQSLTFGHRFNQSLDNVTWPAGLQSLTFGEDFHQSLDNVTWPAGLQSLTFGNLFNQNQDNVTWPVRLLSLTSGNLFNQNQDNVTWPVRLLSLTFGGLQSLTFGDFFDQDFGSFDNVTWSAGLESLTFGMYVNQSLDNVIWPAGLQSLTFGRDFNQSLDNVTWPAGLQSLTFGYCFNQSLDNVTWPGGLQHLTFEVDFNQSLDNVTWPAGLQSLTFGLGFNQSLDNVTWPAGLQSLTFGGWFNQSLDNVTWPAGLQSLTFGDRFDQSLDNVTWPADLQSLTFGGEFNQNLDNVTWPAGLQSLTFGDGFDQSLDNVTWPAGLQSLTFDGCSYWNTGIDGRRLAESGVVLPRTLRTLVTGEMRLSCDALRKELEVDCVLFDGGNIRGDRTYLPQARHHRGSKWAFTVADLRRELPWPSQMATVTMEGWQISEAVQASRIKVSTPRHRSGSKVPHMPNIAGIFKRIESSHQLVGGFLQCDSGMQVRKDSSVSHIAGEDINLKKRYTVAVLYDALMGMNQNPVFEKWRNEPGNRVPGQCPAARELLTRHFLRRLWKLTQNKLEIKEDEDISRDKLLAAISKVWPRAGGNMRRSLLRRLLATVVAEDGSGRGFKSTLEAN
eukprot:symbB.v1.2.026561.t2/scaffold2666.1/size75462/1